MDLKDLRTNIDRIDKEIILLLSERLSLMPWVADYKLKHNIGRTDKEREKQILKKLKQIGKENNLREEYIKDIFKRIIIESHFVEKKFFKKIKN